MRAERASPSAMLSRLRKSPQGDAHLPQAKGGADALVEQVAGKHTVDIPGAQLDFGQGLIDRILLEAALRLSQDFSPKVVSSLIMSK